MKSPRRTRGANVLAGFRIQVWRTEHQLAIIITGYSKSHSLPQQIQWLHAEE